MNKKNALILFLCMGSAALTQAQGPLIQWDQLVNLAHAGNVHSVKKISSGSQWDSWARSANQFDKGAPGVLKYTLASNASTDKGSILGIGSFSRTYSPGEVEYGFRIEGTQLHLLVSGAEVASISREKDCSIALKREQSGKNSWKILFQVNGETHYSTSCSEEVYYAYVMIKEQKREISGVNAQNLLTVLKNNTLCGSNTGSIDLMTNAGVPPYSYRWSDGATSSSKQNLAIGSYAATVSDAAGNSSTAKIRISSQVIWEEESNAVTTTSSITQTDGSSGLAWGYSINRLESGQSGRIVFQATDYSGVKSIGLGQKKSTISADIEWGFLFSDGKYSFTQGRHYSEAVPYALTDVFELVRNEKGMLQYLVNGVLVGSSSENAEDVCFLKANLDEGQTGFHNIGVDFCGKNPQVPCAQLKRKLDGARYITTDNRLYFSYEEGYTSKNAKLHYKIYNISNRLEPVLASDKYQLPLKYGDNRYRVNVTPLIAGTYILEVENEKNETFFLRFIKS